MSRTLLNFWLDLVLLLLFLGVLWCAFVVRFAFPPATLADGWSLWGWNYDHWAELQFALTSLLGVAVLLHVMLHWTWVCGVITSQLMRTKQQKRRSWSDGVRTLYGVGLLVVIVNVLGVAFAAALLAVQGPG